MGSALQSAYCKALWCLPQVSNWQLKMPRFRCPQEEVGAPAGGRRRSSGARTADPHFIGYTYKNWDAVHPPPGLSTGVVSLSSCLLSFQFRKACLLCPADPHFIGCTSKSWDAMHPPPGVSAGAISLLT